jgi:hypothetical protein
MKTSIERFFSSQAYAVVGVSRSTRKFGNVAFREMKKHGLDVYPVNPYLEQLDGERCFESVSALPAEVQSVIVVVHPEEAERVVAACKAKGIANIWLQQGAESDGAIVYAQENGLNLIHGYCVLMFLEPVKSFHAFHRWIASVVGRYPR